MIKLTTKGRAPRLYDCFGEKITAKEGADRLGISIHTMRNRLQLYGDNMEEVMHFYQNREEKRSEPKMKKFTEPEERAVAELAEMLCGGGNSMTAPEEKKPFAAGSAVVTEGLFIEVEDQQEFVAPSESTEEVITNVITPDQPNRKALAAFNAAIKAIEALDASVMDDQTLCERLQGGMEELKAMRRRVFDHMVDWDAIAKGGTAK